jgi:hypothetical protein
MNKTARASRTEECAAACTEFDSSIHSRYIVEGLSNEAPLLPRESWGINFQSVVRGDRTIRPEELLGGQY